MSPTTSKKRRGKRGGGFKSNLPELPPPVPLRPSPPPYERSLRRDKRRINPYHGLRNPTYVPQYIRLNSAIGKKHPKPVQKLNPLEKPQPTKIKPCEILCKDCTFSLERDAEFWGRSWNCAGELVLLFTEDHSTRYPNFLLSFLLRMQKQVKRLLRKHPALVGSLIDSGALVADFLADHPDTLVKQLSTNLVNISDADLADTLKGREDLARNMLDLNPELLAKIVNENRHLVTSQSNDLLEHARTDTSHSDAASTEMNLDKLKDALAQLSPASFRDVVGTESNYQDVTAMVLRNEELLEDLLSSFTPEALQQLLDYGSGDMLLEVIAQDRDYQERILNYQGHKILTSMLAIDKKEQMVGFDQSDTIDGSSSHRSGVTEATQAMGAHTPHAHMPALRTAVGGNVDTVISYLVEEHAHLLPGVVASAGAGAGAGTGTGEAGAAGRGMVIPGATPGAVGAQLARWCEASQAKAAAEAEAEASGVDTLALSSGSSSGALAPGSDVAHTPSAVSKALTPSKEAMAALEVAAHAHGNAFWPVVEQLLRQDATGLARLQGLVRSGELRVPPCPHCGGARGGAYDSDDEGSGGSSLRGGGRKGKGALRGEAGKLSKKLTKSRTQQDVVCPKCAAVFSASGDYGKVGKEVESTSGNKHVWLRFLGDKTKTKDAAIPIRKFIELIWEIYKAQVEQKMQQHSLHEFVLDFMLLQYGKKELVKVKLRQLIKSLKEHLHADPFVTAFAQFIGFNLPQNVTPRDKSEVELYLWAVERVLENQVQLELTLCDNESRKKIAQAGGAATLGSVRLREAQNLLGALAAAFSTPLENLHELLEQKSWAYAGGSNGNSPRKLSSNTASSGKQGGDRRYTSLEGFLDVFLGAADDHRQAERDRLVALFRLTDADGSGAIDYGEFIALVDSLPALMHLTEFQRTRMFNKATEDEEELDVEQFIALAQGEMRSALSQHLMSSLEDALTNQTKTATYNQMMADHVMEVFKQLDKSESGEIKVSEFPTLMGDIGFAMSENEANAVVRIIDKDGNGTVDFGEFLEWWREYAMEQIFVQYDADGSGELSLDEVEALLKHLGIAWKDQAELDAIFAELDVDSTGGVTFAELVQWFAVFDGYQVFMKYDEDKSGSLGAKELNNVLKDLGMHVNPAELNKAIDMLDTDKSGELSYAEFMPWYTTQQRQQKRDKIVYKRKGAVNRRQSAQFALATQNDTYLKMNAQRERMLEESTSHLKNILLAIAEDLGLEQKDFLTKYHVEMQASKTKQLLK